MKVNLNARVRVTLTVHGISKLMPSEYWRGATVAKDGVWECQLWELMAALGEHMHNGSRPLIVGNDVEVVRDDD